MDLEEVLSRLGSLSEQDRAAVLETAILATQEHRWVPNPGPQTDAYFCAADVLLYGGQGGGGKSDLGLGLAFTAHRRSLILRRRYTNLGAIIERALEINGTRAGFNGSPPPKLRTPDGRLIEFGANQHLGDEQGWQGQPYDLKVFDEACQFLEQQVRFHLGWIRTTDTEQRTRALLATNPPIDSDGDWLIGMFRPWLDLTHPNPAKHGELRWYITAPDGEDLEVDGPEPKEIDGKTFRPMSRTFIPAALKDNPFLVRTDYQSKLDSLPEPLRSAVRDGNFMAARQDATYQVIPTQWIIEAQDRWKPDGHSGFAMTAMAFDPAGGGNDSAELCWRFGGWYAPFVSEAGESTSDPSSALGHIVTKRRDNAPIVVDVGGGYGGPMILRLKDNGFDFVKFNGAEGSNQRAMGSGIPFANKRAEAWWRFREALDPSQIGGSPIALPPDPQLRSELASACYDAKALQNRGVYQIESKDELRKRLGRSPGKGDACVMCLTAGTSVRRDAITRHSLPKVVLGHSGFKRRTI